MHKILKESDSHFIVELPNGVTIKVAKNGLTDKVKDKVLYLAEGGMVPEKGFIPIPEGPTPLTVPVNVKAGAPIPRFENVRKATKEELDEPAPFAPGTPDVYRTAIDQVRPVKQAPFQPKVEEYAPGGAEEPLISPLDFITPPGLGAVAKGAGRLAKGIGTAGKAVGREVVEALPRVMASEVGAVGGQKVAPRINPLGMYSKLEQTIAEKMGGSATPDQILGMLRDVKPEELEYSGLKNFLNEKINEKKYAGTNLDEKFTTADRFTENIFGKEINKNDVKISKQEILDFVKANELPIQEKIIGANQQTIKLNQAQKSVNEAETSFIKSLINTGFSRNDANDIALEVGMGDLTKVPSEKLEEAKNLLNAVETKNSLSRGHFPTDDTQYSKYQLPGGENYREKLYTLPEKSSVKNVKYQKNPDGEWDVLNENGRVIFTGTEEQEAKDYIQELDQVRKKDLKTFKGNYQSSHFDEPNILAHTRLNDRVDAEGRKHLFAEEIQSDWHQAGRGQGYQQTPEQQKTLNNLIDNEIQNKWPKEIQSWDELESKNPTLYNELNALRKKKSTFGKVPDAPFKKNWHEFVSKNLLSDAAKGGYDNVSWTTGAQQNERYKLSKFIEQIEYKKSHTGNGYNVMALDKNGSSPGGMMYNASEKELEEMYGKDLTKHIIENSTEKTKTLRGQQLEIGGEGMKGFYDKIIPDYMGKLGKKYGVKPEKTKLPEAGEIWTMKITPEMREDILNKGLPMYAMGGMVEDKKGNNMDYKMLKNEKDFYVMQHPDGSSFKVAKKGLKPEVKSKIESYSKFMQKAEGGVIPGVDQPEQMASTMPQQPKEPDFAQMAMDNPRTPQDDIKEAEMQIQNRFMDPFASMGSSENYTPEGIRKMAEEQVLGERERQAQMQKNAQFVADQDQQKRIEETLAYNERAKRVGMPLRPVPGQKQELPLEMQTATAGQAKTDMPDMPPMATKKPETDPFKMYEEGLMGEARARQKGAEQQAETYKNLQTDLNAGNVEHNKKLEELYAKQKAFEDSASKAQVNPDRYWQNASVPRKMSASIGLILGGIGAGLTGGENAALKIINQTIDQDIEAQKKNIDQANNLYRMNLDAIKNEKEAYNVTKAQMIGVAELRLKEQMARTTSQEALAQGKIALGKMQLAKQQLLQQTALDQVVSVGQDNPQMITPEILEKLPADQRERFIPGYGFTISKPGAEKIRTELLPQKDTSVQMIDDLINIRKKYGRELTNRDVVNEANTLRSFLRGSMRTFLVGPGAVTENEQKILDQVIADPTKILTTDAGTLSALNSLKNSIDRSFVNQAKANGLMVKQPQQAQGQQPVRGDNGKFYIQQGQYMVPVRK